jgi:TetR/AcrR family transcriptional regulator, transcriptional repressor for nem operon
MARPRAFDRDIALDAALDVFWRNGYEATSTDDLRYAMGIGRQSLYDTFGDKRRVYLESLERYQTRSVDLLVAQLRGGPSPLAAIRAVVSTFASASAEERALGCMGVSAICDFGSADDDVAALSAAAAARLHDAFETALREGIRAGEVRPSLDPHAGSLFLQSLLLGLKVSAKAGASPESLRDVANVALEGLTP